MLSRGWMLNPKFGGMQGKSRRTAVIRGWSHAKRPPVSHVSAHRMTGFSELNPNLIGPPGLQSTFQLCKFPKLPYRFDVRHHIPRVARSRTTAAKPITAISDLPRS